MRNLQEERQEGMLAATSCQGCEGGAETPEGQNPRSATCLKMAGRRREEEAAGRLGKPVSGAEAGSVGAGGKPRGTGVARAGNRERRGFPPPDALKGQRTPGEVPSAERLWAGTSGKTVKEGRTP